MQSRLHQTNPSTRRERGVLEPDKSPVVDPEIPPRVEYALTPLGKSLLDVVGNLVAWSEIHTADIDRARTDYDQRHSR
jgi:hypothetical protein